jgi:hypothetical protein
LLRFAIGAMLKTEPLILLRHYLLHVAAAAFDTYTAASQHHTTLQPCTLLTHHLQVPAALHSAQQNVLNPAHPTSVNPIQLYDVMTTTMLSYHLQVPAAALALDEAGPSTHIVDDGTLKPRHHQVGAFSIHLRLYEYRSAYEVLGNHSLRAEQDI